MTPVRCFACGHDEFAKDSDGNFVCDECGSGNLSCIDAVEASNKHDPVEHPSHYTQHPSGVECIDITEHFMGNLANAIKYIWRAGRKGDAIEDLKKAAWYVNREIQRQEKMKNG